MDALIVVDMQAGLLDGAPKHDLDGVVARINRLSATIRARGGHVVFVQHAGPPGDAFAPGESGWRFLDALDRAPHDHVVGKTLNDAFHATALGDTLAALAPERVIVAGWATDLCVDATVRSAAARGWRVVVAADAHTVSDRPHLAAPGVIAHHHWVWTNLIAPHPVDVRTTETICASAAPAP